MSAIADDPRVRRQGDAFAKAGWDVVGIGLSGALSNPPAWPVDDHTPALDWSRPPGSALNRVRGVASRAFASQRARLSPGAAEATYWARNARYASLYERATRVKPDIWLANDWTVLPIARRLAAEQGGLVVYDTHELAADEFAERWAWRFLHRPFVMALEGPGIRAAALVTCVSEGIAERLQALYGPKERPMVVCNTPSFQDMPFRPTEGRIRVLYHGIVAPGRGLEASIQSVALWRPEFDLTIRGPASDSYRADLERRIAAAGLGDRVRLVPAVPMTELVREANAFDVGLFILPGYSRHNRFALPNKFFEYVMAGLALCVSDLPEMARLVRRHDLGGLVEGLSPEAIAAQINALDPATIDCYKRNALAAARQLNWETEGEKLVARCSALVKGYRS
nr:glycosyltransferase [Microvirga antarctica]